MTLTGNTQDGQTLVSNITTSGLATGMLVSGTGIQSGSTIQYIINSTSFILSQVALLTQTGVNLTFVTLIDSPVVATVNFNSTNSNLTLSTTSPGSSNRLQAFPTIVFNCTNSNLTGTFNLRSGGPAQLCSISFNAVNSNLTQNSSGLSVTNVIDEILLLFGMLSPQSAPAILLENAVHTLNAALQAIWSVSKDTQYFSRTTVTIACTVGVSSYTLAEQVLTVAGPVRLSTGQTLRMISTRDQFDNFGPNYLGQLNWTVANGNPIACFIEQLNTPQSDNVTNILHIIPAPSGNLTVLIDNTLQPPRFQFSDYLNQTQIQMPNLYADSILLPFVRYKSMNSLYFTRTDRQAAIVSDYQGALRLIGAVDPQAKEVEFTGRSTARGD